jgi:predicted regulator of Ras-like GTPase activity (Roadblock/LC7/MglB family)
LPLAIALNYLGSDQLNEITVGGAAGQVILLSLGAVMVALLCRWLTAQLGRQLVQRLSLRQMRGILALVGLIGLTLGGALGFLAV